MAFRISLPFSRRRHAAASTPNFTSPEDEVAYVFGGRGQEAPDIITRHSPAIRWLGASVLFGAVGAVLLGAALYVTEEQSITVERAEVARAAGRDKADAGEAARKGDKLVQDEAAVATSKSFKAPLTERVGDREITRMQSFVRVAADLPLTSDGSATDIPSFDPIRAITGENIDATPPADINDATDADVSMIKSDLDHLSFEPGDRTLSDADVTAQIQETLKLAPETAQLPASFTQQRMLSRTLRGVNDFAADAKAAELDASFHSIAVRIVPENVTNLFKNQDPPDPSAPKNHDVILGKDDTLEAVLQANGADQDRIGSIKAVLSKWARTQLAPGQHIRLLVAPENGKPAIERVTFFDENGVEEVVAADDDGHFVAVALSDRKPGTSGKREADTDDDDDNSGISVYESLYNTALKNGAPREIIEEIVRVFAFTIDFQHHVEAGDHIGFIFKSDEGPGAGKPELLYAALKIDGETHRVYRFQSPATGDTDYFDEDGHSLRKFLLRKPIVGGRISSPFGMRYHPILGYARLHNGVDWAAPRGTPIVAVGDGVVKAAGAHSGYGNRIELSHAYGYGSAYNHMAGFAKGIAPGVHVHLGQVIGYLGTTGLSTGPHVHYEVTINGHFVDPMKIRLPSGQELSGSALASFKQREQQIDELRRLSGSATVAART